LDETRTGRQLALQGLAFLLLGFNTTFNKFSFYTFNLSMILFFVNTY